MPCAAPSDCPVPAGECEVATCEAQVCGTASVPAGTEISVQTAGDCQRMVCNGNAGTTAEADDADAPDDGADCTIEGCSMGSPVSMPAALGAPCDDGAGDACDGAGQCVPTLCGDGLTTGAEACDDGNTQSGDGCDENCTTTACGNGIVTAGEACDDGGTSAGDGCGATCLVEAPPEITAILTETCARFAGGLLKCWGQNSAGELGQGDGMSRGDEPNEMGNALPAINLGAGLTAAAIAGGDEFMCALLNDGNVKCWGDNLSGQLGLGDFIGRGDNADEMGDFLPAVDLGFNKLAKALGGGEKHMCAILLDDSVKCWGINPFGELGLGDTVSRGYGPNQMGDVLPTVNLGTGLTAKALSGGFGHMCALLSNDSVKCWGYNAYGVVGLGNTSNRGDAPNEMGDNLPVVNLGAGKTAKAITSADNHACAILDNDSVKCWGRNSHGQLGLGDTANRGDGPSEMGNSLLQVNLGAGKTATAIAAGAIHTCALLNDGSVKCWGSNFHGQLGLGDTSDRGDEPNEMGDSLPAVNLGSGKTATAITAGYQHTCAVLNDSTVKCWGHNLHGELGLGDASNRGDGPNEMGDNLPAVLLP